MQGMCSYKGVDKLFEVIPGTFPIIDDNKIQATTEEEHDIDALESCEVALKKGLHFNAVKCNIKQSEVMYFGNITVIRGVKLDPNMLLAISHITIPKG